MASNFGTILKLSIFGQSHSEAIGAVLDGLPAGEPVDLEQVQTMMDRRAPGRNAYSTARQEADVPVILSGLSQGKTCGAPLAMLIANTDARAQDYEALRGRPRPSHADYPAQIKYGGANDPRGGGHFSGRMTAPLCFAGAVCLQFLERRGIFVGAHIAAIEKENDLRFDPKTVSQSDLLSVKLKSFPVIDDAAGVRMRTVIEDARCTLDSVGGVVECCAIGLPVGLGEPIFDGLENHISQAVFAIPAVKGIEFGAGFGAAAMRATVHNDPFYRDGGQIKTRTNHHGGSLGGLASGMPLVLRVALKPTPSIGSKQESIDLKTGEPVSIAIGGRQDPCVVPRAVPCVEAAVALALLDLLLYPGFSERGGR